MCPLLTCSEPVCVFRVSRVGRARERMQGAWRRPWRAPRTSRATPQTPLSLPTLRERADFPSSIVVASLLGPGPTASAPPRLRGNLPRSRPREILRQAPSLQGSARGDPAAGKNVDAMVEESDAKIRTHAKQSGRTAASRSAAHGGAWLDRDRIAGDRWIAPHPRAARYVERSGLRDAGTHQLCADPMSGERR